MSIILKKKLLENTKTLVYFDSNEKRDGIKERKVDTIVATASTNEQNNSKMFCFR